MRILFSGSASRPWMSGSQRATALRENGADVRILDQSQYHERRGRLRVWLNGPFSADAVRRCNDDLLRAIDDYSPQIAWLEWPRMVERDTLAAIRRRHPGVLLVSFQDDNPFGRRRHDKPYWTRFIDAIPDYDVHFVKRATDMQEFGARGARKVVLFEHGTVPGLFRPPAGSGRPRVLPVSFIGTPLDRRVATVRRLQGRHKVDLHVFGGAWNRTWPYYRHRHLFHAPAVEQAYVDVVWSSRISLGFVSHSNLDEYSMRSFEVPACGGFFLAERTPRHTSLYREGVEAEFFSGVDECADKIKYYLANEEARARIAAAGCERAHRPEFTLKYKTHLALQQLKQLR